jgi:polyadenylate-binding protein 2
MKQHVSCMKKPKDDAAVENAMKLDGSTFKDRQLKVTPKRVNDPNFYISQQQTGFAGGYQGRGRGGGRGGGFRGRGGGGFGRGGRGRGGRDQHRGGYRGRGRGFQPY